MGACHWVGWSGQHRASLGDQERMTGVTCEMHSPEWNKERGPELRAPLLAVSLLVL